MRTFKHTHLSTRFDRTTESLDKVVSSFVDDAASIITLTEVDSEKRENVLKKIYGFGVVTGDKTGRDDCAILWNKDHWDVLHRETFNVSEYMAGNIGAALVVLQHVDTGHAIVVSVVHLPSAVEGNGRLSGGRVDEWYAAKRAWARKARKMRKRFNAQGILLVADWNADLKKLWVRALIKTNFPFFKWTWKKWPRVGTHGNRLIDFTLYKGKIRVAKHPKIHAITKASDHRGYEEWFAWTS